MADALVRAGVQEQPVPEYEDAAFTTPVSLSEATVAIVTTAGFRREGEPAWGPQDPSFRAFETDETGIKLGHLSPNFDRSGFIEDVNVVYPVDRLKEMAAEGVIGAVAPRHLSFMGAQDDTMTTLRIDTGPAAAKQLREDGVDVILLTPV